MCDQCLSLSKTRRAAFKHCLLIYSHLSTATPSHLQRLLYTHHPSPAPTQSYPLSLPPNQPNPTQAREAGGDELDDLVSAPRMVLQQYVDKWFPEDPSELARLSTRSLKKILLDVSISSGDD